MKTINIQNEANIKAKGEHTQKNTKSVICIETGEVWTSATDTAETVGVSLATISAACTGKIRTVKGKHYCYLSKATENLDAIVTRLRETAAVEADAKKWQAYQAEQEAVRKAEAKRAEEERKAEAKRQAEIAKAAEKVVRRSEICKRLEAEWNDAMARLMEAEKELEALQDNNNQEVA